MLCYIDFAVHCLFAWDLWVNSYKQNCSTRMFFTHFTWKHLLLTSHTIWAAMHEQTQSRAKSCIPEWRVYVLVSGDECMCWGGCMHMGISIQSNIQNMYTCNYTSVILYTYIVKYTYADLVKRQTVAKYGSWVTCGASGNTSDTNTKHGLHEWVSVMPWCEAPKGWVHVNPYTPAKCFGMSDIYSV